MCNVIVQQTVVISPGGKRTITVLFDGPGGLWEDTWEEIVFTGCATEEKFDWWKTQGDEVTIPAEKYGEKNKTTKHQGFGLVPPGTGLKAVVLKPKLGKTYRELKVVTTDGGEPAERLFGNNRVPLFASLKDGHPLVPQPPLQATADLPLPTRPKKAPPPPAEGDLFS